MSELPVVDQAAGDEVLRVLSPREIEILDGVTNGFSNAEIAEHLFIGINTVKTHLRHLYDKVGVQRRSQLIVWGAHHGFLRPPRA